MEDRLDAYARPPSDIKTVYKTLQKLNAIDYEHEPDILTGSLGHPHLADIGPDSLARLPHDLRQIYVDFLGPQLDRSVLSKTSISSLESAKAFEVSGIPGLLFYPSLLPPEVQLHLLDKLLHRDLSNAEHKTNVDLHYQVPRPESLQIDSSYFDGDSSPLKFLPTDPTTHKTITKDQFLNKKLSWITLGGQYDWTEKVYPSSPPPAFPSDIKQLVERIFPMKAEAAIVNFYASGDTLSLHRDVSEACERPLVSISLGCDGIFVIGLDGETDIESSKMAVLRLRSGDAVLMSGDSRYAWHGVPKVLERTCPDWMSDWPAMSSKDDYAQRFARWKGWMAGKRINLNIRQMFT